MSLLSQSETAATDIILPLRSGNGDSSFRVKHWFRLAFIALRFRSKASIFVRKTLQVLPCEIKKALAFFKAHRKDLRFSMKMMFATDSELRCSPPVLLLHAKRTVPIIRLISRQLPRSHRERPLAEYGPRHSCGQDVK